ncbi:aaa family atpase [Stylonychia lemnae]|uniref:Aaa family atpase n=1 Tax=Stylonychia lemnae TaxID=5949 RepID=A0A078A5K0_STYLE|nr:aaa family atpase [Stylonychia lemnae]|eukprot:CDW77169.1 aaa family atpase [Stylonychia lemnae]
MCLYWGSIIYIPLGVSSSIYQLQPFVTLIVGYFWIGEKLPKVEIFNMLCAFSGVMLIIYSAKLNSHYESEDGNQDNKEANTLVKYDLHKMLLAAIVNFISAFIGGTMFVVLRKLKKTHFTIVNGHYALVIAFVSSVIWIIFRYNNQDPIKYNFDSYQYILIIIISFTTALGNMAPTLAVRYDKASRISSVNFLMVLVSYLGDVFLFGYQTHPLEVMGAIIIIICSAITMILKYTGYLQ